MTEQTPKQPGPSQGQSTSDPRGDIRQDLRELADTLEQAVRGLTSSDKAKELEQEVRKSVTTFRQQTETALKDAKLPEAAQELSDQAKRVAEEATKSQPLQDVLTIVVRGLTSLSQRLERYVATGDTGPASGEATAPDEAAKPTEPSA